MFPRAVTDTEMSHVIRVNVSSASVLTLARQLFNITLRMDLGNYLGKTFSMKRYSIQNKENRILTHFPKVGLNVPNL